MPAESQVGGHASQQDGRPHYRFRDNVWSVICGVMDWKTMTAAAESLGVRDTTISRAVSGDTVPGEVLMAALMAQLEPKGWKHDLVFELVPSNILTAVPA